MRVRELGLKLAGREARQPRSCRVLMLCMAGWLSKPRENELGEPRQSSQEAEFGREIYPDFEDELIRGVRCILFVWRNS